MRTTCAWLRYLVPVAGALALASCAPLPPHISVGNNTTVEGPAATFAQCDTSVRFSGNPRPLSPVELSALAGLMTKFYKWEVDALGFEKYRLSELALCMCRDSELSISEISQAESTLQLHKDYRFIRAYSSPHSRKALEVESLGSSSGVVERMQIVFPNAAPRCIFGQIVRFEPSISSPVFLATTEVGRLLSPGSLVAPSTSERPKATTAHRLGELTNLRQRGLITQEEYEQKRKAILEGL